MGIVAFMDMGQASHYEGLKIQYHQRSPLSSPFIKEILKMNAKKYLSQNKIAIAQQCQTIVDSGSKAIITAKKSGETYIHKVSTVEEFSNTIPDNKFFKPMRDGINNAVLNKVIPIVIFEEQKARIISLPEHFDPKS